MDSAGGALKPGLGAVPDVTRQKVAAEKAVLRIGVRDRRHRAARAGPWILPGLARILLRVPKHNRRSCLGISKIVVVRDGRRARDLRSRLDRRGLLGLVFAKDGIELVGHAAAAGPGAEHQREGYGLGAQPP